MPAVFVGAGTGRGEQSVEQHVDVAHREPLVLADERERVEAGAGDVRQVALRKVLLVLRRHPEGIEQKHAPAELSPAPGGDAPELTARVDDDGGAVEPAVFGREQVEGDGGALAGTRRRHGDGGALEGPADQPRVGSPAPLAEQDAPALREPAHEAAVQQHRPAVEVGVGAPAAIAAAEMLDAVERRLEPEHRQQHRGGRRHDQHHQTESVEGLEPRHGGAERGGVLQGPDGAGPERGQRHREPRPVEPEAEP